MAESRNDIRFAGDLDRLFYTAYRPIILKISISDPDVAFIRGELFYQSSPSASFVSTGVLMNAYQRKGNASMFEMNIMEYCRPYVSKGICPVVSWQGFSLHPSSAESCSFYVHAWPVRYSTTAVGQVIDDLPSGKDSLSCVVVGLNTDEKTSTDYNHANHHIDKYVLGKNGNKPASTTCMPMTNAPFPAHQGVQHPLYEIGGDTHYNTGIADPRPDGWGVSVDMSDNWTPSTYYLNGMKDEVMAIIIVKALDGTTGTMAGFTIPFTVTDLDMQRFQMHPLAMELFVSQHLGYSYNQIVDASGNLACSGIYISLWSINDVTNPNYNYWGYEDFNGTDYVRWVTVNYSDIMNGMGPCGLSKNRVRFHWKNALGGFDYFNFYGDQEKSVKVTGTRYEKFNDSTWPGLRGTTDLWTKRQDTMTVMSQPLNELTAIWLEELATSPQVWIEEQWVNPIAGFPTRMLPVNIVPGSYATFKSADRQHFMEIKYTLANSRTTQRG